MFEIYSRALSGIAQLDDPKKLNGTLSGQFVVRYLISPDSAWVVYSATQERPLVIELYSRRIDGTGSFIKLNGPVPDTGGVRVL